MPARFVALVFLLSCARLSAADVDLYGDPLPDGATARFGTVFLRKPSRAVIVFLPDGKSLPEVDYGLAVRDYDADTGRLQKHWQLSGGAAERVELHCECARNSGGPRGIAPPCRYPTRRRAATIRASPLFGSLP
ncbi:MAG: hypothetical protein ACJ8F7_21425 [Gemmataceae bacterium]